MTACAFSNSRLEVALISLEITLSKYFSTGNSLMAHILSADHETECAKEGLCLLALPMEVDTDGDITQRE